MRVLDAPSSADEALIAEFGRRHDIDVYLQRGGPGTIVPLGSAPRTLDYSLPQFGITLRFAPTDFVQVNAPVNAQMVAAAVELAAIEPGDRVLDLYCGLGNFSLPFAQRAAAVLGVEGEAGLVARAVRNAALNGLGNARFLTADLAKSDWSFFREHWDIVVLDPPRTGADVAIAEMRHVAPRRIVYVSCHPATLARDARVLVQDLGYRLTSARRSRHVPAYPPCRSDGPLRTVRSRPENVTAQPLPGRRIVYDSRMGKEIERKFLVRDDAWRDGVVRRLTMRQGYLAGGRARIGSG